MRFEHSQPGRTLKASVATLLVASLGSLALGVGDRQLPTLEDEVAGGGAAGAPVKGGSTSTMDAIESDSTEPVSTDDLSLDGGNDAVAAAPPIREAAARPATTVAPSSTSTTAPNRTAQARSSRQPVPANRPAAGTRVVEKSDQGGYFVYEEAEVTGQGSSFADTGLVKFLLSGRVVDGHGRVSFDITNESGGEIAFPEGGIVVRIIVTRPDGTDKVYEVRDTTMTSLRHAGRIDGEMDFPLTADGQYSFTGEVLVEYR